jgi:hypothetical protein
MNACPRAWALTYGRTSRPPHSKAVGRHQQPRTFDEVLTRTMRAAWRRKIEDLYQHKLWSAAYTERVFTAMLNDALSAAGMDAPALYRQQKIRQGLKQIRLLEQSTGLRPLVDGQPRRWAYFDRLDSEEVDGVEFYAAPELAVYHQHRWTLIRIQFRSPRTALMGQQLEHLLTVLWALKNEGLPDHISAFRLKVIQWNGTNWQEHNLNITPKLMEQAIGLVKHDVQEMTWLSRWAKADPSLNTLPLAVHHKHCRGCHHRKQCPAIGGLVQAKLRQQHELLRHSQSEATKSLKTA